MKTALAGYLNGSRRLRLGRVELRVLSSYELLQARAEAGRQADAGLRFNCAVLARALQRRGKPVFSSTQQVMERLSPEQVETLVEQYRDLCRREDLLGASLYEISRVLRPADRLRGRVLRQFGVLPMAQAAREMTDGDVLFCAAMLEQPPAGVNPAFDQRRFEVLQ